MNEQFQLENERIRCKMNDNFKTININYILKDGKKWTACERKYLSLKNLLCLWIVLQLGLGTIKLFFLNPSFLF